MLFRSRLRWSGMVAATDTDRRPENLIIMAGTRPTFSVTIAATDAR